MENTRKCPFCAEEIPSDAAVCPYCGESLGQKKEQVEVRREESVGTDNVPYESGNKPEMVIEIHDEGKFEDVFNYSGRISRKKYWLGMLATYVVLGGVAVLLAVVFSSGAAFGTFTLILIGLLSLFMILNSVSATVRRLNDAGNEYEWYKFIAYLPLIGPLLLVVPLLEEGLPQTPIRIDMDPDPDKQFEEIFVGLPENATVDDKIMAVYKSYGKLSAIKYYKEVAGCGLAESKEYVDILEQQNK